ncbi:beta-galactosidase [Anaerocolumna sp. MB42-C2]|uniref:beta-galactosidase n=1 Tax=Anaerocolumna sp. MB42-C2 TaxID=3070997 RepID=UPI0027E11FC6|nr:beta-galactosidase [Anaerocolumna sp. MB42-C2]WMJ86278.1 beta-galactosidase [Anaerocolumna sp. MB42-C2]
MQKIKIQNKIFNKGITLLERDGDTAKLRMAAEGAGLLLPELIDCQERYVSFYIEACENHSVVLALRVYVKDSGKGPAFDVQFGILPGVRTPICIDRNWMDGHVLFPEAGVGQLKQVCHGRRVVQEEIEQIVLETLPVFHDFTLKITDIVLSEEYPSFKPLAGGKMVDEFGQNKQKMWSSKVKDLSELKEILQKQEAENRTEYPFGDWSVFGGWKLKKLGEETGYFTKYKADGKWFLADPSGYAFFSVGPDCVGLRADCRVDGVEKWLDWLPDQAEPEYRKMFRKTKGWSTEEKAGRNGLLFSYSQANLYRALGKNWYPLWQKMITGQLRRFGMNTLGNWSDERLFGTTEMPYVMSLPEFPGTSRMIFRDFPDVFSEEYTREAKRCAAALKPRKNDPLMIGYFLRNEPNWAFVNNLVLADEVLYNIERTECKEELIRFLKEKYGEITELNKAYHSVLEDFDDFYQPRQNVSHWSEEARKDMREFSRRMLQAYVEIPCRECRKVDSNHMILGMRWAWVSDPDLVTGWENFDVFSINCYSVDPTVNIQNIVDLGVDLPVMIGEFHFGALDAGLTATGLEGVASQRDRGAAYRYYCERVAAHAFGVGCHYFQCYDQFVLGRFDGENYNIGLFDICSQPYTEMVKSVQECSRSLYLVKDGQQSPTEEKAVSIPMIAF